MTTSNSVRVEIDETTGSDSGQSPRAPQPSRRNGVLLAAIAVIGLVALALIVLRPAEGETLAGTQRTTPTTTSPTTDVQPIAGTTDAVALGEAAGGDRAELFSPVFGFNSVVRHEDDGAQVFLALSADSASQEPRVLRSETGVMWESLRVEVPDFPSEGSEAVIGYSHLIEVGDEVAMLRVRSSFPRGGQSLSPEVAVHRLLSPDGAEWRIDEDFAPVELVGDATPVFHDLDSFGVQEELLVPPMEVSGCANVFAMSDSDRRNIVVRRRGAVEVSTIEASAAVGHTPLEGGEVAALTVGRLAVPDSCEADEVLLDQLATPALEILGTDGSFRSIEVPIEVQESMRADGVISVDFVRIGDRIVVLAGNVVWTVGPDGQDWSLSVDRSGEDAADFGFRLKPDGWLIGIERDGVNLTDLLTGDTVVRQGTRFPYRSTLYVDEEVMLAALNTGISVQVIVNTGER